jgi:16S rRNA (cytidine1402-2'-O)-methyltransferase
MELKHMNSTATGTLYVIPNTLGNTPPLAVMPTTIRDIISSIDHFVFEKEKVGRSYIKSVCPEKQQSELFVQMLNKHTSPTEILEMLAPCMAGNDMALISDAGCPGVADPGADLVRLAHGQQIVIRPLVGPSSILLALMGSGLNGQQFAFNGYLPIDKKDCKQAIKKYERLSFTQNQTQIFIETPYRNERCFTLLLSSLSAETLLNVACDLTLASEQIQTKRVSEWNVNHIDLHKRPCVFSFLQPSA